MKRNLLVAFCLVFSCFIWGQETYVPDDNFENYLETHDINGNVVAIGDATSLGNGIANDDYITTSKIVAITSLNIASEMIADITGIEDFEGLEVLDFSNNGVGDFDLSSNINLKELNCASNGISNMDISSNINLEILNASDNGYTSFDVSTNSKLKFLDISNSGATTLNLGTISALEELHLSHNQLTTLNISNLINLAVLDCEANYNLNITDFSTLINLRNLNCTDTNLRSLDLSHNLLLETVSLNNLSGFDIDLSSNTALTSISAMNSDLTNLNVKNGNNVNIISFDARFNQFSCIQVDDPTASYLNTWRKDNTTTFNLDCSETNIPDLDFEYYLEHHDANGNMVTVGSPNSLGNGKIDDGYVLTSRIAAVTSLNIAELSIGELIGIEDFTALEILDVSRNNFNDIDVSSLSNLKELYCHNVFVPIIDVSSNLNLEKLIINEANCIQLTLGENTALKELNINTNSITALDITDLTALEIFNAANNYRLEITDFSSLTNLKNLNFNDTGIRSLDVSSNTGLEVLSINNVTGFDVDLSTNTALTSFSANESDLSSINIQNGNNANITYFDARLNSLTLSCIQVDDPNASYLNTWLKDVNVNFSLDCRETNVPDDNFENYLETHDADGNTVVIGDVTSMGNGIANDNKVYTSRIENVVDLNISNLGITDVTGIAGFKAIQKLRCNDNNLTSLDLSENLALENLDCYKNNLSSINISQNRALTIIQCFRNELTTLDVSNNIALTRIDVFRNQLSVLDISNNTELTSLSCARNQIGNLDLSNNSKLERLSCYDNNLTSLDTTNLPALTNLDCVENDITSLDLSQNPELQYLQVYENQLTSLDVSKNVKLIELYAEYNEITSLDVSKNTVLEDLSCYSNQLTYLNMRNGNNVNLDNNDFNITDNPGLTCVAVDDPTYATATFTDKDSQTVYGTFCNTIYVPDDIFEAYLETHNSTGATVPVGDPTSMGNGIANDDYVGKEPILNITFLNISNQNIVDFTGLEAFENLEELRCFNIPITDLDLRANTKLKVVEANSMNLNTINVTGLTNLTTLRLNTNNLTNLNVSTNLALENLSLSYNSLTAINISNNIALRDLRIVDNDLITLDVSNNSNLVSLYCSENALTTLDVSNNPMLETLSCGGNQITSIDVSILANITDLFIDDTPTLTALDVSSNLNLEDIGVNNTAIALLDLTNNTKLIEAYINDTAITTLDFSNSPDIEYIECRNNELTTLNIKNGNNSRSIELYATGNPNLTCVEVDDPTASYLSYWEIDPTASFAEYCELTYVPNDNFEALLEARGLGNGIDNDDYVYTGLISVETSLIIQDQNITDVTGIEDFESLELLLLRRSNVASIDLSQNTKLTHLNLTDNNLTTIDLANNIMLEELYIDNNTLGVIDISSLTALTTLGASNTGINTLDISNNSLIRVLALNDNQLTTLDVSAYPSITQVRVANNQLESLNVANGTNTSFTWFDASGNSNLTCIKVDDINGDFSLWTKDDTATYAQYCELTYVPDDNFENYLETHDASGNVVNIGDATSLGNGIVNDDQVATLKIETVTTLNIESQSIADLTGIADFIALESLNCDYNDLTTLDITHNTNLKILNAAENDFTTIDLTPNTSLEEVNLRSNKITSLLIDNNPNLKELNVGKNRLTTLDVTSCIQIEELVVHQNLLTTLDVRNGNNNLITNFFALYNPDLSCIKVDNPSAGYLASWEKDDTASFSENCELTVEPYVYLQGAYINPNSGEEHLMRDDLRIARLIPTTSPYTDALTCDTSVFNIEGNTAVVDWIEIQLRDKDDPSIIIEAKSALLLRNGAIVTVDGISKVTFTAEEGDYFIAIQHRNHLPIMTNEAKTIDFSAAFTLNLNDDPLKIRGGTNAVMAMENGVFAMIGGDYNKNGQIQNSDVVSVIQLLGGADYNSGDLDMNGQIQNTDINNIINPNLGKGQQF